MYDLVLVATDGSPASTRALDRGFDLARTFEAEVHVIHVINDELEGLDVPERLVSRRAEEVLEGVREQANRLRLDLTTAIRRGVPHLEIDAYADEVDAGCCVLGTYGRTGAEHGSLGSTTDRVLRTSDLPVYTVRIDTEITPEDIVARVEYENIFLATDGSAPATRAAEHAIDFANYHNATLHARYYVDRTIFDREDSPKSLLGSLRDAGERALAEIRDMSADAGIPVRTQVGEGVPDRLIVDRTIALPAQLIVLGRRGRTGYPDVLLGSTTERVIRRAEPPVLSVT